MATGDLAVQDYPLIVQPDSMPDIEGEFQEVPLEKRLPKYLSLVTGLVSSALSARRQRRIEKCEERIRFLVDREFNKYCGLAGQYENGHAADFESRRALIDKLEDVRNFSESVNTRDIGIDLKEMDSTIRNYSDKIEGDFFRFCIQGNNCPYCL